MRQPILLGYALAGLLLSLETLLVLVAMVLIGKFVIWTGVARLLRYPADTAIRDGIGLTQIGEFSFILAQVSLSAGLISEEIYHAALATSRHCSAS